MVNHVENCSVSSPSRDVNMKNRWPPCWQLKNCILNCLASLEEEGGKKKKERKRSSQDLPAGVTHYVLCFAEEQKGHVSAENSFSVKGWGRISHSPIYKKSSALNLLKVLLQLFIRHRPCALPPAKNWRSIENQKPRGNSLKPEKRLEIDYSH